MNDEETLKAHLAMLGFRMMPSLRGLGGSPEFMARHDDSRTVVSMSETTVQVINMGTRATAKYWLFGPQWLSNVLRDVDDILRQSEVCDG